MEWLDHVLFWHWWILAGVLLILELTKPVYFFLWLGFAASAVGFLLLVFPGAPVEAQLVMFGVLSIMAVVAWRKHREIHPPASDQTRLKQRGRQYTGCVFTLEHPIINGVGKLVVGDSTWRVKGPDLAAGTLVRVVGVDGVVFIVESAESS